MYCAYCGTELPTDSKFCPKCGKATPTNNPADMPSAAASPVRNPAATTTATKSCAEEPKMVSNPVPPRATSLSNENTTTKSQSPPVLFSYPITNLKRAKNAARFGTAASVAQLILTFVAPLPSGLRWVIAIFYLVVAIGTWCFSRIAAVAGLIWSLVNLVLAVVLVLQATTTRGTLTGAGVFGIVLVALFVIGFVHSVRGTFAYHRFRTKSGGP